MSRYEARLKGIKFMRGQLVFHMQQMTAGPREGVLAHRIRCEELTCQINERQNDLETS